MRRGRLQGVESNEMQNSLARNSTGAFGKLTLVVSETVRLAVKHFYNYCFAFRVERLMANLLVRRLLIDLKSPIPRHWCGGDPFRTALLNALSMSFPIGENFFINSVKRAVELLPESEREHWATEIQGFIGQEATHRRIHGLFNDHLAAQGLVDSWTPRAAARMELIEPLDPRHALAATAATEHFTSIMAGYLFANHEELGEMEPRLKTMWLWHAAEESEHRATVFDLYCAVGGTYERRVWWMKRMTYVFVTEALRQTFSNLWRDGTLFRWRTWASGASFLFGKKGMFRLLYQPWRDYFKADFHPSQHDASIGMAWLRDNEAQYSIVGASPAPASRDEVPVAA